MTAKERFGLAGTGDERAFLSLFMLGAPLSLALWLVILLGVWLALASL